MAVISAFNLKKRFNLEAGFFARFGRFVYAVNDVSFSIGENESYGLVGESGCGKTTTARLLVRMYKADSGRIIFQDREDVLAMKRGELKKYRERVKYVFQDPARSLNPRMSIYDVLVSGYRWSSRRVGEKTARREAAAVLEEVGLDGADLERRSTEFSGGQRQRISIARGLLMKPDLLICDEVVSALDVSIQGQILNLLLDIRSRHKLSFLFIAHDLKVACYFCDRIGVMYRGELMEEAPAADLYRTALHPYTRLLFSSALGSGSPAAFPEGPGRNPAFERELKTPLSELAGCAFAERCPLAEDRCFREQPVLQPAGRTDGGSPAPENHRVRCFRTGPG
ncbi:MAG: ABC transporter ATP-binding protein [Spirochaetaceae bacterium]|jgi:oligopeptide/dipeptide ABC transporter ATP-binding protein|nr:ABC transporter ATP-binding protein [Spirochaetaceae bacterium]